MCWDDDEDEYEDTTKMDYILQHIMEELDCELTEAYEVYCNMSVAELREKYHKVDYREMYI